jgi:hypothetical protein
MEALETNPKRSGRRCRVQLCNDRLYSAVVEQSGRWVRLTDCWRLSRHLDGYAGRQVADFTVPARDVLRIRERENDEPVQVAA